MRRLVSCALVALVLGSSAALAAGAQNLANPAIDTAAFLRDTAAAMQYRESRRVTEAEFIRLSRLPGTVILDARSKPKYDALHVRGAVNLSLPWVDSMNGAPSRISGSLSPPPDDAALFDSKARSWVGLTLISRLAFATVTRESRSATSVCFRPGESETRTSARWLATSRALPTSAVRVRCRRRKLAIFCSSLRWFDKVESTRSSICVAETLTLGSFDPGTVRPAPSDVM